MAMPLVHPPAITDDDLGPAGWRALHEMAAQRRRKPREQIIPLLQSGLARWLAGLEVEPTREQLEALFDKRLESVA
jgi:hypothetical protein